MKDWKDDEIKKSIEAAMPQVPEDYALMIENTISELKRKNNTVSVCVQEVKRKDDAMADYVQETKRITDVVAGNIKETKRRGIRWYGRLAVAIMILVAVLGGTFTIYPALTSEIPLINQCVYALSPTVEPKEEVIEKITEKVTEVLREFLSGEQADIERHLRGENEAQDEKIYLPIAYLRFLCNREELHLSDDSDVEVQVNIGTIETKKKAFVYEVNATFELISKEGSVQTEECFFRIIENTEGYYVQGIELQSEGYQKYVEDYMALYGEPIISNDMPEQSRYDNALMIYQKSQAGETYRFEERKGYLQMLLEGINASKITAKQKERITALIREEQRRGKEGITEETRALEDLASELMYRYYQGRVSGVVADFSDILVRNVQTDLFFYESLLAAERTRLGVLQPLAHAEKGQAEVLDYLQESESEIQVRFYVRTELDYGVGEEIILTFEKIGGKYIITGYDRAEGDGIYLNRLKPLAEQYRKEGINWEEANRLAYETILKE